MNDADVGNGWWKSEAIIGNGRRVSFRFAREWGHNFFAFFFWKMNMQLIFCINLQVLFKDYFFQQ
jgi:hypothetical protein